MSGVVSAALLSKHHDVSLFEAESYLGGHANTVDIKLSNQQEFAIDTGFVVFNKETYPNFSKIIKSYNIAIKPAEMSFSFRSNQDDFEYNGHTLNTLFADRSHLLKPKFYRFIKDIIQFNIDAKKFIQIGSKSISMQEFILSNNYSQLFVETYLVPIIASIWSKKTTAALQCNAMFLLEFFLSHGLLNVVRRPQWYSIDGGSRNYINTLMQNFRGKVHLNTKIEQLTRMADSVVLKTKDDQLKFDAVILAVHSDQALAMLEHPTHSEHTILNAIRYSENEAVLHTDDSVLPKRGLAWASWNYYNSESDHPTLTYYMNRLQHFKSPEPVCLSMNLTNKIAKHKILKRFSYAHPVFDAGALQAQKQYSMINGVQNTYYCGAYWGFGFHEDGVKSALRVCKEFGVTL